MSERLLPHGWKERLYSRGDLRESEEALRSLPHFYTWGLRGWLNSLQLQPALAERCFSRARNLAPKRMTKAEQDLASQISAFHREHCLITYGPPNSKEKIRRFLFPADLSMTELVRMGHLTVDAGEMLSLGRTLTARLICWTILSIRESDAHSPRTSCYIGLAAAALNEGALSHALEFLAAASLHIELDLVPFTKVRGATKLVAVYEHLGMGHHAAQWRSVAESTPCTRFTIHILTERAKILCRRAVETGVLYLL